VNRRVVEKCFPLWIILPPHLAHLILHESECNPSVSGAIDGIDHRGFIGEVYKLFPFPQNRDGFKQNPEGFKNRSLIENLIQKYAKGMEIYFRINKKRDQINIGEYAFNRTSFQELVKYIWQGGYPRWKDDIRPDYVLAMKANIDPSKSWLFDDFNLQ